MILFCLPQPRMLGTHRVVGVVTQGDSTVSTFPFPEP